MRIKRNGQRYFMDESIQRQAEIAAKAGLVAPTMRQSWLSLTRIYLDDLDLFAAKCGAAEALQVVTARAALKLLVEYLERNR